MPTHRILIADDLARECVKLLESRGLTADYQAGVDAKALPAALKGAAGLLVRSRTKVTAEILAAAPDLKVVGRAGSGVDNVDVPAATGRKVVVMNVPGGNTRSVAELAIGLIFSLVREIPQAHGTMAAGKWDKKRFMGREVQGKTLAIVGPGKIGREVATMAKALGMHPVGVHPNPTPAKSAEAGMPLKPLAEVLPTADIVSLHVPSRPETKGLFNAATIQKMKKGAYLVNCARGDVLDEAALIAALDSGQLAGAALDVFAVEPLADSSPLRTHARIICLPHLGATTSEAQDRVAMAIAGQVADYLLSGKAAGVVNPDALKR